MADKNFGVKQINLIGASGVPTIESPNNLNINATQVAISTDLSVGQNITVTGGALIGGSVEATDFYGDGSYSASGQWVLGANGTSSYTFTGIGVTNNTENPVLYLARGRYYKFLNNSGGSHPFEIRVSSGGTAYNNGVINNGSSLGVIEFTIPFNSPNTLFYQCTNHAGMGNTIYIYPSI